MKNVVIVTLLAAMAAFGAVLAACGGGMPAAPTTPDVSSAAPGASDMPAAPSASVPGK